jgi:hypothetical protein
MATQYRVHTCAAFIALAIASGAVAAPGTRALPRADGLRKVTDAIGTRLRDGVISTGDFAVSALQVTGVPAGGLTEKALETFNVDLARRLAAHHSGESLPAGFTFGTSVRKFSASAVTATAKIIAGEVNDYDPASGEDGKIARALWVMMAKLGVKTGRTVVVSSRAVYRDDDSDPRHVTVTSFVNQATGKMLAFYMVEGRM